MRYPPPWLQEGLAVCFEGAGITADGELEAPRSVPPPQAALVRQALAASGERWWGVRRLVSTASLKDLQGTEAILDFYAQAAFLVSLLLEDRVVSREIFYRLVDKAREPASRPENAWADLESVLRSSGETVDGLEERFRTAAGEPRG